MAIPVQHELFEELTNLSKESQVQSFTGASFGKCLIAEGLAPENSFNIELRAAVDSLLTLHYDVYVEDADALLRAIRRWKEDVTKA